LRPNKLRQLWQQNITALNVWLTIPSAWTAEIIANAGYDSVTIDMQHGLADYQTALSMMQAVSTTDAVPTVRVPWNEPVIIMRTLDAGAYGIICPMVNTRADAEAFVGACRYPPLGYRSHGPIRADMYAGEDYFYKANETVLAIAMIETAQAVENLEEIATTPGLDGIYVGTIDLSISMGIEDLGDIDNPILNQTLDTILSLARRHNLITGIHANSVEQTITLAQWGFNWITPVDDSKLLRESASKIIRKIRTSQASNTS